MYYDFYNQLSIMSLDCILGTKFCKSLNNLTKSNYDVMEMFNKIISIHAIEYECVDNLRPNRKRSYNTKPIKIIRDIKYCNIDLVCIYGDVNKFREIVDTQIRLSEELIYTENAINFACMNGHSSILKEWFIIHHQYNIKYNYSPDLIKNLCIYNAKKIIKLFLFINSNNNVCINVALRHLLFYNNDIIYWLVDQLPKYNIKCINNLLDEINFDDHERLYKLSHLIDTCLEYNIQLIYTEKMIDNVFSNLLLEFWFKSGLKLSYTEKALDNAISSFNIPIIRKWVGSGLELKYTPTLDISHISVYEDKYVPLYKPYIKSEDEECSICLDPLLEINSFTLQCNHHFHEECIEMWFSKNVFICPYCKTIGKTLIQTIIKFNSIEELLSYIKKNNYIIADYHQKMLDFDLYVTYVLDIVSLNISNMHASIQNN